MLDATADPLQFSEVRALQHVKALSQDIGYRHVGRVLQHSLKPHAYMLNVGCLYLQVATEGIETASIYIENQLLNLQLAAARSDVDIKVIVISCCCPTAVWRSTLQPSAWGFA